MAVIGVPDERWGEAVCAVVAFRGSERLDLEGVRDYLTGRLARYKLPSRLVVLESVPRNGAGKLDKPQIRATVAEMNAPSATVAAAPFTEAVGTVD